MKTRRIGHLTPAYMLNRYRRWRFERRNPDAPWITAQAVSLLESMLLPTDQGLELGSGRSTYWLARRIKHLVSVENDPAWYEKVKTELSARSVDNVAYNYRAHDDSNPDGSPYVCFVREQPDRSFDFIFVDGAYRCECVQAALPKIRPGGILAIDNVHWFLDHPTRSPYSRFGKGASEQGWRNFERAVAGWRKAWTSDGTNDTAIWIAPPGTNERQDAENAKEERGE